MKTAIPYILAIMILYDFSLHIFDFLINKGITKMKHPFGVYLLKDYFAGDNQKKRERIHDIFWTTYWGIGSILIILYLLWNRS